MEIRQEPGRAQETGECVDKLFGTQKALEGALRLELALQSE